MTQEETGDKGKVEEPKAEETKTLSPQEETDALRQQLKDTEEKAVKFEEEAKAHQKVVSKKEQELQDLKLTRSDFDELRGRQEMTEALIAELGDKTVGTGEGEPSGSFTQKVRADQLGRQRVALAHKAEEVFSQVDELLKDTGLTKESPELKAAGLFFSMGTQQGNTKYLDDALKEVQEVVAKLEPKKETKEGEKVETEEERIERKSDERLKEKMIAKGLLTPEGGEPSAASPKGFAKVEQDYAEGKISTAEYDKAMKERGKR